jgi:hypothetical protein
MLEKLFKQFVPSVPSEKNHRVQPEAPQINAVPPVPSVPPEKKVILNTPESRRLQPWQEAENDPVQTVTTGLGVIDIPPQPDNMRRFCRKYQHSNHVYGWDDQVIRCAVQNQVNHDDLPRHCSDFATNGLPIPTVGVRWQPESIPPQCTAIPKVEYQRFVECFTPEGISIQVMAKSAEHETFLLKMNPKILEKSHA